MCGNFEKLGMLGMLRKRFYFHVLSLLEVLELWTRASWEPYSLGSAGCLEACKFWEAWKLVKLLGSARGTWKLRCLGTTTSAYYLSL